MGAAPHPRTTPTGSPEHDASPPASPARAGRPLREELEALERQLVRDRDRAVAQHAEAVADREAAVRTRARMEAQRDEAIAEREAAELRRDEAFAQRDEARRQRDEALLAHKALQKQLRSEWAARAQAKPPPPATAAGAARAQRPRPPASVEPPAPLAEGEVEQPLGVRVVPATRTVAAHIHRGEHAHGHRVTNLDLWTIRVLGTIAAVCFIALLVVLSLTAIFVF